MKKLFAFVLALTLIIGVFSGCNLVEDDDSNVIVAKVGDVSILKTDYDAACSYYVNMFVSYYGYDTASAVQYVNESMGADIIEQLVAEEVLRQKAEAEGYFNYTEEDNKAADEIINEDKQAFIDSFVEQYTLNLGDQELKGKNEGESNEDYFKRIAADKYLEYLEDYDTSIEEMKEEILKGEALERFREDKLKDVTVLYSDVESRYSELLAAQKQAFTTDEIYVKARNGESITLESGATVTYDTIVYNRAGYSLVQHILIGFEEEDLTKLKTISTQISTYDKEIETREKAIADETDEEIKAQAQKDLDNAKKLRDEQQEQYDIALEAAKAKIQAKTDEVYNSVKDGDEANFIKVMIEKTEDTGMVDEATAKEGYLVGAGDGMVEEFSKTGQALETGEISEPVATIYGYHIIRCMEKLPVGKVSLDKVRDEIKDTVLTEKKESEWTKMCEIWRSEADASVEKYEDRI